MTGTSSFGEEWELEVVRLLLRAKRMRGLYKEKCKDKPPYSVDDYLELISKETGYEIDLKSVNWESSGFIRGICLPFENNVVKIRVPPFSENGRDHGATLCEQRFIALKEASHLVVDEEDAFVDDCLALVDDIVFGSAYLSLNDFKKDGRSDVFYGKIFAMELLFPAELRDSVKAEIDSGLSEYDAAKRFLIPEKELIWILSNNIHPGLSSFRAFADSLEGDMLKNIHPEAIDD